MVQYKKLKKNLDWFNDLEKKPLILKGQTLGKNGRIVFTSKLKQALCLIKKIVTK